MSITRTIMAGVKRRLIVPMSALTLAISIYAAGVDQPAYAVICQNSGAGGNPAGNDGGNPGNTACGLSANASGTSSSDTAIGNQQANSQGIQVS
jgi:hypothetical protein